MNLADVTKEPDTSKIVKEDVLRILGERKKKVSLEFIETEIKVPPSHISKTVRDLLHEDLIAIEDKHITLTEKGREEAKDIVKKHLILENYFKESRSMRQAHRTAHLLEHYVSNEVVNNVKKLFTLKEDGVPLTEFELSKEALITDIFLSDYRLFERIVSMGMFLGEKIVITNRISQGVIVKIGNKKFALGRDIAERIKVVGYETY